MTAVWPPGLPTAMQVRGFEERAPSNVLRTPMETGPAKIRRRSTAAVRSVRGAVVVTEAQLATLDDFFTDTLADGALPFEWTHPTRGTTENFRFVSPPSYSALDVGIFTAVLDLEILP